MNCIACKSDAFIEKYPNNDENWTFENKHYTYLECTRCGLLRADPIPTKEVLDIFYKYHYDYNMFQWQAPFKRIQAKSRINKISKHLKKSDKYLDFGCGHGYLVKAAAKKGINSFGFDVGAEKIIQNDTHTLTYGNDFDAYPEQNFDVISLWHVLEHMAEPDSTVLQLSKKLKTGGKLIIAVPNSESLGFKIGKEKWGWSQQPFVHIHHYNAKNLSMILKNNGFEVLEAKTYDTWDGNIYDILMQQLFFRNRPRGTVSIDYNQKINFMLIADSILRLFFTPISYLLNFLRSSKSKNGAELRIVSRKL